MEFLAGVVVLVVIAAIVGAFASPSGGTAGTTRSAPPRPTPSPPVRRHVAPPPQTMTARQREIERQRIGDEAFFDGVVFSHYFLDDEDPADPDAFGSVDDDLDDGYYD